MRACTLIILQPKKVVDTLKNCKRQKKHAPSDASPAYTFLHLDSTLFLESKLKRLIFNCRLYQYKTVLSVVKAKIIQKSGIGLTSCQIKHTSFNSIKINSILSSCLC